MTPGPTALRLRRSSRAAVPESPVNLIPARYFESKPGTPHLVHRGGCRADASPERGRRDAAAGRGDATPHFFCPEVVSQFAHTKGPVDDRALAPPRAGSSRRPARLRPSRTHSDTTGRDAVPRTASPEHCSTRNSLPHKQSWWRHSQPPGLQHRWRLTCRARHHAEGGRRSGPVPPAESKRVSLAKTSDPVAAPAHPSGEVSGVRGGSPRPAHGSRLGRIPAPSSGPASTAAGSSPSSPGTRPVPVDLSKQVVDGSGSAPGSCGVRRCSAHADSRSSSANSAGICCPQDGSGVTRDPSSLPRTRSVPAWRAVQPCDRERW